MNTLSHLMSQLQADLKIFDTQVRSFAVRQLFTERTWLTTVPLISDGWVGDYDNVLKALLLRIPVPVYAHERPDGSTYEVLRGGNVIEALRALRHPGDGPELPFYRRIMDTELEVTVFRTTMSSADVNYILRLLAI